ncbi:DUF6438 domain-containing protein [uncultured Chryseobacterium sp.]|uniref:DUF6438 domain-containing protein n=1 Tax=uncultured Chryseobacterium sp. TaxID=259322 RepID=UPI0025F150FB|nr:DUF6438 domain-containing protein [uncultured Chryseobacterium sp.]
MKKLIITTLIGVFAVSCHPEKQEYLQKIIGTWIIEKDDKQNPEEPILPFTNDDPQVLIFGKDGTYTNKNGFFKFLRDQVTGENQTFYFGEKTKYVVKNDSLLIFDQAENRFTGNKILHFTARKIILEQKDKSTITLIPFSEKKFDNPPIDEIIVSKSPCFGSCPQNSSVINKTGYLFFYGESNNSMNGLYKNGVADKKIKDIFNELDNLDIKALKPEYQISVTDLSSQSVTFVSKGKIIKTVYNYDNESPFELRRLIRNVSYLYQNIPLKFIDLKDPVLVHRLKSKAQEVILKESETFYLFHELLKSKQITDYTRNLPFSGKYYIDLPKDYDYQRIQLYERIINTDGRFFRVQKRDESFTIYDLGYNFFIRNHLIQPLTRDEN